jgi:hypothetical protein
LRDRTPYSPVYEGFLTRIQYDDVMSESDALTCAAKLARVVLDNCGPLSPAEVAEEARLSEDAAADALAELDDAGLADCVCGLCESKERVYALTESAAEPS